MREVDAAVIGAGPGGLAAAAELRRRGVEAVVIDRDPEVASSWRRHYDRLHLHTVRWMSGLPGLPIPREYGRWVSRAHVVGVPRAVRAPPRARADARHRGPRRQPRRTRAGRSTPPPASLRAASSWSRPGTTTPRSCPISPGRDTFEGELVHASDYRNAEPYRGRDVLVVGSGNTGAEIAVDLVEGGARRVRLAVRTPPNIVLRQAGGFLTRSRRRVPAAAAAARRRDRAHRPALRDRRPDRHGLPNPERGIYTRAIEDDVIPIIDVGLHRRGEEARGRGGRQRSSGSTAATPCSPAASTSGPRS